MLNYFLAPGTTMWRFVLPFVLSSGLCATQEPNNVAVNITIVGTYHPGIATSLAYHRPAFDLAVDDANHALMGKITFNVTYVNSPPDILCELLIDECEIYLTSWYYMERRPTDQTVIMLSGNKAEDFVCTRQGPCFVNTVKCSKIPSSNRVQVF